MRAGPATPQSSAFKCSPLRPRWPAPRSTSMSPTRLGKWRSLSGPHACSTLAAASGGARRAAAACRSRLYLLCRQSGPVPLACSIYSYDEYPYLWESVTCLLSNTTYPDRVDLPGVCIAAAGCRNHWQHDLGLLHLKAAGVAASQRRPT
jgi:hypothetical protein